VKKNPTNKGTIMSENNNVTPIIMHNETPIDLKAARKAARKEALKSSLKPALIGAVAGFILGVVMVVVDALAHAEALEEEEEI
jgi:hypothetical protein